MTTKLTWDDLLVQDFTEESLRSLLECWRESIDGRVMPLAMSKFGDWFLRREDGSTEELSVVEGTIRRIAETPAEFTALMNEQRWQEQHLLSLQVLELHERAVIPADGECYAFAAHPILSGRIILDHVMIMKIRVWQHICAQVFGGKLKKN